MGQPVQDADPGSDVIDRWVLARRIADIELLESTLDEIVNRVPWLQPSRSAKRSVARVTTLVITLHKLNSQVHEWLKLLPDPTELKRDYDEAVQAYQEAVQIVGDDI